MVKTVTTLSQPCDKVKDQLLIWHMWMSYVYSRNAIHHAVLVLTYVPVEVNIMTYSTVQL